MSAVLSSWNRLSGTLPGRLLVSGAVWVRAPYFLTAAPVILELDEKHSRVRMQKWWLTHNHLGTVHAIASCNLAEYAMGVLAEAAVPASHRWIPIGMDPAAVRPRQGGRDGGGGDPRRRRPRGRPRLDPPADLPAPAALILAIGVRGPHGCATIGRS